MEEAITGGNLSVLTWIDDLFDTRLSTMCSHDLIQTMALVPTGYDVRTCDNFIWEGLGITQEDWETLWDNRDDDILVRSIRSGVPDFIREVIGEQIRQPFSVGAQSPITLTINTYPYYLTEEVKSAFIDTYRELIYPTLDVRFIRRSYQQLTPGYVMAHFNMLIHYDYDRWLVEAAQSPESASMVMLNVIGPRIWKNAPNPEEQARYAAELEHFDIHMLAEIASALVYQLNLVPVDLWVAYKTNHNFTTKTNDILWPEAKDQVPKTID